MAQDTVQDKLIDDLQDMYAVENHLVDVLGKQVDQTKNAPEFQAKIQEHLEQTKMHRQRMADCLNRYGKKPSGGKDMLSAVTGTLQGLMSGARPDDLAMTARDDYVAENFEISSYNLLMATAMLAGDQQTLDACQMNLRDEVMTAKWLERHLGQAALKSLQQDGISVGPDQMGQIQSHLQGTMENLWAQADRVGEGDALGTNRQQTMPNMENTGAIPNDSPNLNNTNTYVGQSTDSAYGDRTQLMGTSRTGALHNAGFPPDSGNIGVGSPGSPTIVAGAREQTMDESMTTTTGGPLRSSDISVNPDVVGQTGGSSGNYADTIDPAGESLMSTGGNPTKGDAVDRAARSNSDVTVNGQPLRASRPDMTPPGEEEGIRGRQRPNPPIDDLREQEHPSQT